MTEPYLAAIGTACMDEYYQADTFVEEGDKLLVRPMEAKAGGMIANAACVMAGYGDHTFLIDYMNDGANSAALKDGLAKEGLDVSHLGLAVWGTDGQLHLLNASQIHKHVVLEPMTLFDYMKKHPTQLGVRVIRVKDS